MLHQGCPIEFFRVQRSPFYFFRTYTFLSVRGVDIFLNPGKILRLRFTRYIALINAF
jgi:hypothetical protein